MRNPTPGLLMAATLLASFLWACAVFRGGDPAQASSFAFALIGDAPYTEAEAVTFGRLIEAVNADRAVQWVLHAGDIKSGVSVCDDATLRGRFELYEKFQRPFVYTPGDNEWTDCHRRRAGRFHPLERLARLRQIFFPTPGLSTGGRPMPVQTQAVVTGFEPFVENVLWTHRRVVFATLHVVGSNNDLRPWSGIDPADAFDRPRPDRLAEFKARLRAALAWLDHAFDTAEKLGSPGVFLMMQANPRFDLKPSDRGRAGFNALLDRLRDRTVRFTKPVVLAHGDFHVFRVDQPMRIETPGRGVQRLKNFTRVQTFGSPDVHWIKVRVTPSSPAVFAIEPQLVAAR